MRQRIRLRKKIEFLNSKSKKIVFICLLFFVCLFFVFQYIDVKVNPVLLSYAELESRKLASIVINNAISENIKEINTDELFIITKDDSGDIKTIDFNSIAVNKMLTTITKSVQTNLKYIEHGKVDLLKIDENILIDYNIDKLKKGIIYEIPSGVIFGNSLLTNIGPKVPVKFNLVGDIVSHINTKINNYGINNALIEINVVLEVTEQVILPFVTNKIEINTSIPIALKLIQGTVPKYYLNGFNQNSTSFALPIE